MGERERDFRVRDIHSESVTTMGRRRFVDTLLQAGFGAVSAAWLTAEDVLAAGRDEVPVVYALTREGAGADGANARASGRASEGDQLRPRRTLVPADWYDDFRAAVEVNRGLGLPARESVVGSAVAPGEYGGANATIHVEVTTEEARGEVPESVADVPIEVTRVQQTVRQSPSRATPASESIAPEGAIPGSVAIGGEDRYGTLAPAMRDPTDGALYFATSNHVFSGADDEPCYLFAGEKTRIGTLAEGYPETDVACIRPKVGFRPAHRIRGAGRVLGQFTKAGLAHRKAEGEPLEKIAVESGHTTGQIQAIDGLTCAYGAICKRGQLKWGDESDFADGDSGSVSYASDPENSDAGVLVGGFNNARTWWPGQNYIWGTAAYHVTEKHGYTF